MFCPPQREAHGDARLPQLTLHARDSVSSCVLRAVLRGTYRSSKGALWKEPVLPAVLAGLWDAGCSFPNTHQRSGAGAGLGRVPGKAWIISVRGPRALGHLCEGPQSKCDPTGWPHVSRNRPDPGPALLTGSLSRQMPLWAGRGLYCVGAPGGQLHPPHG